MFIPIFEIISKEELKNTIPPITNPLGSAWRQPSLDKILVTDTHVIIDKESFDMLYEYSTSQPSGVYPGKIWKLHFTNTRWILCWFSKHKDPKFCNNNRREIIVIKGNIPKKK